VYLRTPDPFLSAGSLSKARFLGLKGRDRMLDSQHLGFWQLRRSMSKW
jgi:hypothetical protein